MGKISQGKFYVVQYINTGRQDTVETSKVLVKGRIYRDKNNNEFRVIRQAHFKYTYEDIDTIRVLTEGYDIGTVQYNLSQRMARAFRSKTPSVRFTFEERELLGYIYYENSYLTDKEKQVLKKILDIK